VILPIQTKEVIIIKNKQGESGVEVDKLYKIWFSLRGGEKHFLFATITTIS